MTPPYYFYYNPDNDVRSGEVKMYNYPVTYDILSANMIPLADCMKPDGSKIVSLSGVLDQKIEIFSIDFENTFMYGINKVEEKLYRYDIKDILKNSGKIPRVSERTQGTR